MATTDITPRLTLVTALIVMGLAVALFIVNASLPLRSSMTGTTGTTGTTNHSGPTSPTASSPASSSPAFDPQAAAADSSTSPSSSSNPPQPRKYVTDAFTTAQPEFWRPRNLDSAFIPLGTSPMYPHLPLVPVVDYPGIYPLPLRDLYNRDPELFCRDPFSPACHTAYWRDWPHSYPPRSRYYKDAPHNPHNLHSTSPSITINNTNTNTNTLKAGAKREKDSHRGHSHSHSHPIMDTLRRMVGSV